MPIQSLSVWDIARGLVFHTAGSTLLNTEHTTKPKQNTVGVILVWDAKKNLGWHIVEKGRWKHIWKRSQVSDEAGKHF